MNKKAMPLLIILILSICCFGFVSAENNTTDNVTAEIEDMTNYIMPVSISDDGIKFSDGFIGFCIDPSKNNIETTDGFTSQGTDGSDIENYLKLAIIESYKAGKENEIGNIISKVISKDTSDEVAGAALESSQTIGDTAVVKINNTTEATFTFELLKSADESKSDCLAYEVSMQTVENDDVLAAGISEENDTEANDTLTATSDDNNTLEDTAKDNGTTSKQNASGEKLDEKNATQSEKKGTNDDNQTTVSETNKTIINKTNTVIVNENNTTIINQKNVKIINKTNETPKNTTIQDQILRTVGNPIFLLVIVIVVIAIVAVVMRRKN